MAIVVVAGALANRYGNGGGAWVRLSWLLGFRQLGFCVHLIEQIGRQTFAGPLESSPHLAYFRQVVEDFGLAGSASLICADGEPIFGLSLPELFALAEEADLLVNLSGHLALPALLGRFRRKAYIDIDPGYTQAWQAEGIAGARLGGHDYYFTIGENIGTADCPIPTNGLRWRPIRQPVVLKDWPVVRAGQQERFTTVASWRGAYGPVQSGGRTYGLKVHEFRKFLPLPRKVAAPSVFEIALDIDPSDSKDLAALCENRWCITDPRAVAGAPAAFRRYVQESGAEFSVAQGIYVDTNSGWFSDRTVRYLASGKPALVQDTGFSKNYPVGEGLVPFHTLEEAAEGAERIVRDYDRHCRAARALAEGYFDSDKVLGGLLEEVGLAP